MVHHARPHLSTDKFLDRKQTIRSNKQPAAAPSPLEGPSHELESAAATVAAAERVFSLSALPTLSLRVSSGDGRPGLCLIVGASVHGCRLFRFAIRIHTSLALEPPSPSLSRTIPFFSHAVVSLHPNFYEPSLLHCRSSFPLPTFFLTCYIHFLACFVLLPCSFCRTVL